MKEEVHLKPLQFLLGPPIDDGLLLLLLQGADPALQFMEDVRDPLHILLGVFQLLLRLGSAHAISHDARRLLQCGTAIRGLVGQDLVHLALGDDGIAITTDARVPEQLQNILQSAVLAVDGVLALPVPVDPAGDRHLVIFQRQGSVGVVEGQRHLRHAQGAALLGAVEDHVLHLGAAQRPGALLAQDPAHRVGDVALSAAVGPDDGCDARSELKFRFFRKGFESLHFQLC